MKQVKVTTDRTVDFHSLADIARCIIKPGMTDEEKALACYEVVRRGMFQYPWVYDERERQEEWHDAVKLLNTYGHGLCGVQARVLGALYQQVFGFENQRLIGVNEREPGDWGLEHDPGAFFFSLMQKAYSRDNPSGHTCVEVFYGGHWHLLDPIVEFYAYTRDGSRIACLEEMMADPSLVTNPSRDIPGLMPDGDLGKVFCKSGFASWGPGPGYFIVQDTAMELALCPGQSVTWFWDCPHKRFFWPEIWAERFSQDYFLKGPRHPDPEAGAWRHYGNGTFTTHIESLPAGEGLCLPFPYVLVGGRLRFVSDTAQPMLMLTCSGAKEETLAFPVHPGENGQDLSDFVMGGYDLEMRLEGDGMLRDVQVDLVFQHNFITRPRLLPGENVVRVGGVREREEVLRVMWVWEEAGGRFRQDDRDVILPAEYAIEVGEIDTHPAENPKYMKQLRITAL